jgi:uncharacterized protein (TIGR03437 family)
MSRCCLLPALAAVLTPAWAEWPVITDVPAPLWDSAPAIATAANGEILAGASDRVLRIGSNGSILANHRVPLEHVAAVGAARDGGAFVAGGTSAGSYILRLDAQGAVIGKYPIAGQPAAIAVDTSGSAYVTGSASEGFVTTPGALKTEFGARRCSRPRSTTMFACSDAFVLKMRPDATVEWATLLGGTWTDNGRAIAIDREGGVWVTGETLSEDHPTTSNAVQRSFGGRVPLGPLEYGDAFVARLDATGRRLLYSTYFGGTYVDYATALAATANGVVITGATQSVDFPASANAHQASFSGDSTRVPNGALDAFVAHFRNSGERVYTSYFGSANQREYGTAVAASESEVAVALAGRSGSCLLHYDASASKLTEECFQLALRDPLSLAFVNGSWIATGRTMQGHEVPGVNPLPRLIVSPLEGTGDNSGPAVIGLWNEYIPVRRPLFAAGSIISIYHRSIGATDASVRLGERELSVLYAGGHQINAVVPADMPIGLHLLRVGTRWFGTVPVAVDVVERWPGLYSGALNQDGIVNSEANPAPLGSIVSLFGNGFGPAPLPVIEPFITTAARGMEVLYAGRAPGTPEGIFQVNARIPTDIQTGRVPVRLVFRVERGWLESPLGYIWVR